ncbi:hypothetical protein [Dryocola clanedunensis]|uniref:hypothetical protein n=1 Tax=Cedecea sulfonylureivorans TaxID=3051154 RepID=UPI001928C3D1|nr:hypothetical protein [Cedecea sulfonylureivorans]
MDLPEVTRLNLQEEASILLKKRLTGDMLDKEELQVAPGKKMADDKDEAERVVISTSSTFAHSEKISISH